MEITFDLIFEIKNVGMPRQKSIIDVESELVSKKPSKLAFLSYPFEQGILVSVDYGVYRSIFPPYAPFSIRLFQDKERRCLAPILAVSKLLSFYLSINQTNGLRSSVGNQISWTHNVRFDNKETVRAIAKAIQSIEERSERVQDSFVSRYLTSLIRLKTFRGLWRNLDNFSFFSEWRQTGIGLGTTEKDKETAYEGFAAGLLSLPVKLLQYTSTARFLDEIYRELLELTQLEDSADSKGLFFEALCYLYLILNHKSEFELFLNGMVVVDPTKSLDKQDNNEFDIIEFLLNDEKKPECHIYACSISGDIAKNEASLRRIVNSVHERFGDVVVRSWYMKPIGKPADFTPSSEETGIQFTLPRKTDC
jgi:hypothetical protein